jgi:Tol biopolymer transport system component
VRLRYFYYAEQIDRLCVGIEGGVDFINLETGETEDRLQLREDGKPITWFDWNSDFTELAYTSESDLNVYLYNMKTGVSRKLTWEVYEPQFARDDGELIGHYPYAVSRYTLETEKRTRVADIDKISNIEVSPDQRYVAVLSTRDVGLFGTDMYHVDIVELSTGNEIRLLDNDEITGLGDILWIAE